MSAIIQRFHQANSLQSTLLADCMTDLQQALSRRGRASLLLSGGRSPWALYRQLAAHTLDWSKVSAALADERWIAADQPGSNEGALREAWGAAEGISLYGMKTPDNHPVQGWPLCEARYRELVYPFDLTLLGMGADGHIASLFADAPQWQEIDQPRRLCIPIESAALGQEWPLRMSVTPWGLLQSRVIRLAIQGEEKWDALQRGLRIHDPRRVPVSLLFLQIRVPVVVYWCP